MNNSILLREENIQDFLQLIVDLANKNGNVYGIKTFKATNIEINSENINNENAFGKIIVTSEKRILDTIDENRIFFRSQFSREMDKMLEAGCSVIELTINGLGIIVNPHFNNKGLLKFDIMTEGNMSNINFYLYDDELRNVCLIMRKIFIDNMKKKTTTEESDKKMK